jgi:hypothetical protein
MVQHTLTLTDRNYALPLIGITAHVYADTFSHYGFSGISSRRNKIINDRFIFFGLNKKTEQYILDKAKQFKENYPGEDGFLANVKSWFAEKLSGALGHGAAVTFPDRPYLKWSFEYEEPERSNGVRDNPATFLAGCEALHTLFRKFARSRPDCAENTYLKFSDIRKEVEGILRLEGPKKKHSDTITGLSVYRFYQAAAVYRTYVLRVLFPSKGLVVT